LIPRVLIRSADPALPFASGARVALDTGQRHYLTRVLRLVQGAEVELFDGRGARWAARLDGAAGSACLVIHAALRATPESPLAIHLGQCLSSADKMDWTIEKAVELGATTITPLFSNRSQVRLDEDRARRKLEHWRAVAEAACMQSGRDVLPTVEEPSPVARWIERSADPLRLVLDPRASTALSACMRANAPGRSPISLLAGPESGLDDGELAAARSAGFQAVSLGPRVLRTETAGLAAIAALQALAGDF
jgi:16S rRNA (uracil1498-N3)-methyltransferase